MVRHRHLRLGHLPGRPLHRRPPGYGAALSDTPSLRRAFVGDYRYESTLMYDGEAYDYPASTTWHGVELQLVSTALADHTLLVGAEYQRNQRIDQNIVYPDLGPVLRDRRSGYRAGLFVQDEWRLGEHLASTLGLRADHNDITGTQFSPRVGLIWNASARTCSSVLRPRPPRAQCLPALLRRGLPRRRRHASRPTSAPTRARWRGQRHHRAGPRPPRLGRPAPATACCTAGRSAT